MNFPNLYIPKELKVPKSDHNVADVTVYSPARVERAITVQLNEPALTTNWRCSVIIVREISAVELLLTSELLRDRDG